MTNAEPGIQSARFGFLMCPWSSISKRGCTSNDPKLSRGNDLVEAVDHMLKRWPAFTRFLDDGRICQSNNAGERSLRADALDPRAWLADVLARIADHAAHRRGGFPYSHLSPRHRGAFREAELVIATNLFGSHNVIRAALRAQRHTIEFL